MASWRAAPAPDVVRSRCGRRWGTVNEAPPAVMRAAFILVGPRNKKGGLQYMPQGTVKWFSEERGYGFISPDDGGEDLFVHHTGIAGEEGYKYLEEGEKVTYEAAQGRKGMQAENVTKA